MEAHQKKVATVALLMAIALLSNPMMTNGESGIIICRMTKGGFKACEPSVSGQNPSPPSPACCSALSNSDFPCLCFFKNKYPSLLTAYNINPDLAMELPAKCNLGDTYHC